VAADYSGPRRTLAFASSAAIRATSAYTRKDSFGRGSLPFSETTPQRGCRGVMGPTAQFRLSHVNQNRNWEAFTIAMTESQREQIYYWRTTGSSASWTRSGHVSASSGLVLSRTN